MIENKAISLRKGRYVLFEVTRRLLSLDSLLIDMMKKDGIVDGSQLVEQAKIYLQSFQVSDTYWDAAVKVLQYMAGKDLVAMANCGLESDRKMWERQALEEADLAKGIEILAKMEKRIAPDLPTLVG